MNDLNSLWAKVLGEIEVEISKANYLTLFKRTQLISLDGEAATIAAPSGMIIDLLQRRFHDLIKKVVDKHTGINIKLIFVPKAIEEDKKETKNGPLFAQPEIIEKTIGHLPRVRADFTFENFAVSSSNQLAFVSASTVAKKLGKAYNPLFIYGPVGVGKTHLMQAIANEAYKSAPDKKIIYITSEEFTNEVVEAIRTNATGYLKKKFRNLDLLIIDDIQFIAGKERVQEEVFHTFNVLIDQGGQIALSSDRPPVEMKKVEKRLISRFSGGLTVDIGSPDYELRTAIILIKARKHGFELPIEIAKKIAEKERDVRELEGLLLRIVTDAAATGDLDAAVNKTLSLDIDDLHSKPHPDEIIKSVCAFYKIKSTQIKGEKRDAYLVRARQVAMFLLKKEVFLTYMEIGNLLGGRDHTTIMHGVEKIENLLKDKGFEKEVLGITKFNSGIFVE
jgi:chromosomal replication initiator protein